VAASSLGKTGYETVAELEADEELGRRVAGLRAEAGKAMGLGDVTGTTVPKVSLVAPPRHGGTISTRTFIPVRVHESIGVLGGVSVGTAVIAPGAVGADLGGRSGPVGRGSLGGRSGPVGRGSTASLPGGTRLEIEHPSGSLQVEAELDTTVTPPRVVRSGVVRTARKLFDGTVFPR
jgi:4-oxalomesaconate tautomerase